MKPVKFWQIVVLIIGVPILAAAELAMLACMVWTVYAVIMIITGNAPC